MAAGAAVEAIWQDFRGSGVMRALAIECWQGNASQAREFLDYTGCTFPMLLHGAYLQYPGSYGTPYDNYVVIDKDGIVRYTTEIEARLGSIGRFRDATLRAAIQSWLPLAVAPRSWSTSKDMYR